MKSPGSFDEKKFLSALGLTDPPVVREVVKRLIKGVKPYSIYTGYRGPSKSRDVREALASKGKVRKIDRLRKEGKLNPVLQYWGLPTEQVASWWRSQLGQALYSIPLP